MKKEQAIKNAYGEYWEAVKDYVDENGWIGFDEWFKFVGHKIDYDCKPNQIYYCHRPKSLKGIEDNNGWHSMSFKEPPYPEHDVEYWIITYGITLKAKWNMVRKEFINVHGLQENVTHWQPIQKPLKPIY